MHITNRARLAATALIAACALFVSASGASASSSSSAFVQAPPMPSCSNRLVVRWPHMPHWTTDCSRAEAYIAVARAFNGSVQSQRAAIAAVMSPYRSDANIQSALSSLGTSGRWDRACVRNVLLNVMRTEATVEGGHRVLEVMSLADRSATLIKDLRAGSPWNMILAQFSIDYYAVGGHALDAGARAITLSDAGLALSSC